VYEFFSANLAKYKQQTKAVTRVVGESNKNSIFLPLASDPGTKWNYGYSIDWVGQVIEKVSGLPLGDYFNEHILHPLGAKSTTFLAKELSDRLAFLHQRLPDGTLVEVDRSQIQDNIDYHSGGHGAYSTLRDLLAIYQAILNGGVGATGARILKKETVDLLFEDQTTSRNIDMEISFVITDPKAASANSPLFPGMPKSFSFGGMKVHQALPMGRASHSVFWSGAANCFWWIDPTSGVAGVLLAQILPFGDSQVLQANAQFERKIYEGII